MPAKRIVVLAVAALVCLALSPSALAVGLQGQRIAAPAARAAASDSIEGGSLIAPESACPDQEGLDAPAAVQEQAMRCLTDFARRQAGLDVLSPATALDQSALDKSQDILRCDSFSHFACGREFSYWMKATGYTSVPCWHVGENLAWGSGEYGTVRSIFRAWMGSPEHRSNILGDYSELGVSVQVGQLEGQDAIHVWTAHFGTQCR